jgi:hypothetical protein
MSEPCVRDFERSYIVKKIGAFLLGVWRLRVCASRTIVHDTVSKRRYQGASEIHGGPNAEENLAKLSRIHSGRSQKIEEIDSTLNGLGAGK